MCSTDLCGDPQVSGNARVPPPDSSTAMRPLSSLRPSRLVTGALACAVAAGALSARAQDIEPRAYSKAPVGVNFLIAGYAYTRGGVAFGPTLPITNPNLDTRAPSSPT